MGDECNCEKCQGVSFDVRGVVVWQIGKPESQMEGRTHAARDLYLVISEGGISLRQKSLEA
jgi:hypothetical protein